MAVVHSSDEYLKNPFWIQKMTTAFLMFDANKNGILTIEDYLITADRFAEKCPKRAKEIRDTILEIFIQTSGSADAKLSLKDWLRTRAEFSARPEARKIFRDYVSRKFDIVDTDLSGKITRKEFRNYFECKGLDVNFADMSFDMIDSNHNNVITRDEFSSAGEEFHFGLDERHPSKFFYGKLVENY